MKKLFVLRFTFLLFSVLSFFSSHIFSNEPKISASSLSFDLHYATEIDFPELVSDFITNGAKLDGQDAFGQTPLHYAAKFGHENIAKLLLEKGADRNAKDKGGDTPLALAKEKGHEAIVALFDSKKVKMTDRESDGVSKIHASSDCKGKGRG